MTERETIDIWFDSGCPFTWATSRWIVEVAQTRPVDVVWHTMSLAITNEDQEIPEQWRSYVEQGIAAARVNTAVERDHGSEALGRFYTEIGTRRHVEQRAFDRDLVVESLAAAGLPASLVDALDDDSLDAVTREYHDAGQRAVGDKAGSPVVALGGKGFFGPIITVIPRGEDAGRLYDGLRLTSSVPGFAELKRARESAPAAI